MKGRIRLFIVLSFLYPTYALSDPTSVKGHIKYYVDFGHYRSDDLNSRLGAENPIDQSADFRLNLEKRHEDLDFVAHGEVLSQVGDTVEANNLIEQSRNGLLFRRNGLEDNSRLFDLSKTFLDDDRAYSLYRMDRLSVGYTSESWIGRVGRQAISWGNGLAFQVMDFFNPFSPTAIDKDYKTGDDLVFQQILFPSGSDLQVVYVPRRDLESSEVESSESTYAGKYRADLSSLELSYDLMMAKHYNDNLYAFGVSRNIFDAVWRADFLLSSIESGRNVESFVTNIDRSWIVFDHNVYTSLEYFRNGFGTSYRDSFAIDSDLLERINRGELYSLAKHALALGVRVEVEPRLNTFFSEIYDVTDDSGFFQIKNEFEAYSDLLVTLGVNLPYGGRNSEYGGLKIDPAPTYVSPSKQVYLKLTYFF